MLLFISLMECVRFFLCAHQKLKSIQPCMCIRINSRSDIQIIMKVQVQIWYCQRIVILCFQKEKRSHSTKSCKPHSDEPNFVCTQQWRSRYVPIGEKKSELDQKPSGQPFWRHMRLWEHATWPDVHRHSPNLHTMKCCWGNPATRIYSRQKQQNWSRPSTTMWLKAVASVPTLPSTAVTP